MVVESGPQNSKFKLESRFVKLEIQISNSKVNFQNPTRKSIFEIQNSKRKSISKAKS